MSARVLPAFATVARFVAAAGLAALAAQTAACFPMSSGSGAASNAERMVPLTAVSEAQDEWLHGHCVPMKVVVVSSRRDGDRLIRASGANFGELVSDDGAVNAVAVAFACPSRPTWTAEDTWVPLAATRPKATR